MKPIRSFPWCCHKCKTKTVYPKIISYDCRVKHTNGQLYDVHIPYLGIAECETCKEQLFHDNSDEQIKEAAEKVFRKHGLESPYKS